MCEKKTPLCGAGGVVKVWYWLALVAPGAAAHWVPLARIAAAACLHSRECV